MASKSASPPLAEKADIHKSCKSLETLLSVLNDYCEAAGATVMLQKKLAKALRETAGMKTTGGIAANALNASATIFEVSSDIACKFAKIADKEYDALSAEVKKWFKKLAKEEKAHDERMTNANAKIKHAEQGQVFEKKSKRNPGDATEEHARYINLISSLGPEISQERYNHLLNVTQRHAAMTYSAAACLSRIADAEWLKTCEGVRRYSPTIGQLGEWRTLCEGGWQGPVPPDLVEPDENQPLPRDVAVETPEVEESRVQSTNTTGKVEVKESEHSDLSNARLDSEPFLRHQFTTKHSPMMNKSSPIISDHAFSASKAQTNFQRTNLTAPSAYDAHHTKGTNIDSVRLSAFPMPPTHLPIPPRRKQTSQSSQSSYPSIPRMTESPLPDDVDGTAEQSATPDAENHPSAQVISTSFSQQPKEKPILPENDLLQPIPDEAQASKPLVLHSDNHDDEPLSVNEQSTQRGAEDTFDRDFGINVGYAKSRAANAVYSPTLQRTDSGASSGSIVATMRNRYQDHAVTSGVISPNPRAVHLMSADVNDRASRYQSSEVLSSPGARTPASRQLSQPPNDSLRTRGGDYLRDNSPSGHNGSTAPTSPRQEEATRRRQQRLNDLAKLELHEKELALRERELELQQKTRELERERARLDNVREVEEDGPAHDLTRSPINPYPPLRPRERKPSLRTQRPQSQLDPGNSGSSQNLARPRSQHNLGPPSPSSNSVQRSHEGQSRAHSPYTTQYSRSPSSPTKFPSSPADHAPYCGCESCSVVKYRASPQSPPDSASLRPLAQPIALRPPKKSSWMRRLSVPVGNAFSFDSKKNASNQNLADVSGGQGRSRNFSLDGKRDMSSTQLNVHEDGRNGISNRSTTNLGLGAGRR